MKKFQFWIKRSFKFYVEKNPAGTLSSEKPTIITNINNVYLTSVCAAGLFANGRRERILIYQY